MKLPIYLIIFLVMSGVVFAVDYNNTILESVGLNTTITIRELTKIQEVYINSSYIGIGNLSQSNPSTAAKYNVTFGITGSNKAYTQNQLPYVRNTTELIQVISDIEEDLNLTLIFYNYNCTYRVFSYDSAQHTYDKSYFESDYNCNASLQRFSIQLDIEQGVNTLGFKERKFFALIDEVTNAPLNLDNVTGAVLFYDDNTTLFDFKTANTTTTNITNVVMNKTHLELEYSDGTIITRYIDLGLLDLNVRICANHEGVTHYEQLITSATQKPAILRNPFSDCVIAADYTRFAYQTSRVLKAYSIDKLYELRTWNSAGQQIVLASIDGSIASYINLDSLEFYAEGYDTGINKETLVISHRNANEVTLYYYNAAGNNEELTISIQRMDTSAIVYNSSAYADPDAVTVIFNHGSLGVNESTLFKVTVKAERTNGDIEILYRYFNTSGATGSISAPVIFFISLLILMFGLTFTATQTSFGWFGILLCVINLGILATALSTWYITFMMAINVIILIYIVLVMIAKNKATIG